MHSADGQPVGLVEVVQRLVVLPFAVLDDDVGAGPVAVDGKSDASPARARVAEKPVEPMLAKSVLCQHAVAQVEDVELVAGGPSHGVTVVVTARV